MSVSAQNPISGGGFVSPPALQAAPRLLSLDAFRGLVIVMMFLVNVAGDDPAFPEWFEHKGWNGGKMGNGLADYVFPWFLFIVGVAIPFSMNSGRGRGMPAWRKLLGAFRRGATIYLLGIVIWCAAIGYAPTTSAGEGRWWGPITSRALLHWDILPLIGFGYFFGVAIYLLPGRASAIGRGGFVLAVLGFKWWALQGSSVLSAQTPTWIAALEQGKSLDHAIKRELGWWGVLLTQGMAASACVVLGSFAGDALRSASLTPARRVRALILDGATVCALGVAWHFAGFASSKDYFSSPYILTTAGSAAMVLALVYWIVDVRTWTTLTPLRVFGMNAVAVYFTAEFLWKTVMTRWQVANPPTIGGSSILLASVKAWLQAGLGASLGSWALVTGYIVLFWLLAHALYRKNLFIRV